LVTAPVIAADRNAVVQAGQSLKTLAADRDGQAAAASLLRKEDSGGMLD
jgi:hypothetical protein